MKALELFVKHGAPAISQVTLLSFGFCCYIFPSLYQLAFHINIFLSADLILCKATNFGVFSFHFINFFFRCIPPSLIALIFPFFHSIRGCAEI